MSYFPFFFRLHWSWLLWALKRAFLETQRTFTLPVYLVHAPSFFMESELLISFCYFVCIILVILCSLLRLSVSHVWSLSLDYILWISARILFPLITLPVFELPTLHLIFSKPKYDVQFPWSIASGTLGRKCRTYNLTVNTDLPINLSYKSNKDISTIEKY